jgi:hypothetical protein
MNCKQGDLAVIVHDEQPENLGRFVTVIEQYIDPVPGWEGRSVWTVLPQTSLVSECWDYDAKQFLYLHENRDESQIPDSFLRPIRDPGEDATDETLLWLPVPMKDSPASDTTSPNEKREVA